MKPKISVIMSVHNQGRYVAKAISSVLHQTFSRFEFIIINDASTDNTYQILNKIKNKKVKIINNRKQLGLTKSLNKALKQAQGKYIARMDADDIAYSKRLKTQYQYLSNHPNIAACGSDVYLIDSSGKKIKRKKMPRRVNDIKKVILRFNPLIHPTVMIKNSCLKSVGNYNESLNGAEDYDLWLKLVSKYPVVNLAQPLLKYRINPQGISWKKYNHIMRQSFKAKINALTKYNYPKWQAIYLLWPLISLLIPVSVKKLFYKIK